MACARSSRAVSSCLAKRPLPIILLPFPPPNSASRRLRSLEVRRADCEQVAGRLLRPQRGCCLTCCLRLPGTKEATTTLHMLTLLKDLLACFPEGLVKSCSETLLRVMTLSHVVSLGPRYQTGLEVSLPAQGHPQLAADLREL